MTDKVDPEIDKRWLHGLRSSWQRCFDLLFGYDYFIAHRGRDGKPYARAL
jgi:hypothetical protein